MNAPSSISDRLDQGYAPAWKPERGDKIVGTVTAMSSRDGGYGEYPIVEIKPDDGEPVAVHCIHDVLKNELAGIKPTIGLRLGIKYVGKVKSETSRGEYHSYRVMADGAGGTSGVDWSKFGADHSAVDGEPVTDTQETDFTPEPVEGGDNDGVPF
jgi:hypothetical protein